MNELKNTLKDLKTLKVPWLLTRYVAGKKPDDVDILVKSEHFEEVKKSLAQIGYKISSHDQALGGRLPGMQVNIQKKGRIKIDLHRNFTWRKTTYLPLDLVWNKKTSIINGISVNVPEPSVDMFIVLVNILFEKTYINQTEFENIESQIEKIKEDKFKKISEKFGWPYTFKYLLSWLDSVESKIKTVVFIPIWLVIFSYFEKLLHDRKIDLKSFAYYLFFRIRYSFTHILPYE
jgi:hypothetical protein